MLLTVHYGREGVSTIEFGASWIGQQTVLFGYFQSGVLGPTPGDGRLGQRLVDHRLPGPLAAVITEEREEDLILVELWETVEFVQLHDGVPERVGVQVRGVGGDIHGSRARFVLLGAEIQTRWPTNSSTGVIGGDNGAGFSSHWTFHCNVRYRYGDRKSLVYNGVLLVCTGIGNSVSSNKNFSCACLRGFTFLVTVRTAWVQG